MRRPRRRLEVSTFPFLAVLLCAMGSLILLLLVLDRRAKAAARARAQETVREALAQRDAAARVAAEAAARRAGERAAERERLRAALHDQLARAKDEVAAQLKAVEGRKSDAARGSAAQDQRWRELLEVLGSRREELARAERETATTRAAAADAEQMSESARKQAARLSAELRGLEAVLNELKESRKRDAQTYSLMPYRGKRGDGRRPLYLECTADGLVFHPDRKALPRVATPKEVRDEVDARVERQRRGVLAQGGQPEKRAYLLMLVRPNGIATYYATVGALKGKEVDFGYEFIDADWVLDFPEGDAAPAAQPWMAAPRIAVAPADPSAPTRKVMGLRPGKTDEFGEGDANSAGTGSGSGPTRGSSDLPPLPGTRGGPGSGGSSPGQAGGNGAGIAWTPVASGAGGTARGSGLPPLPGAPLGGAAPGPYDPRAPPGGSGGSTSGGPSGVALVPGGSRPGSGLSPQQGGPGLSGAIPLGGGASGGTGVPNPDGAMSGSPPPTPGGAGGIGQAGGTPGVPGTGGGTPGASGKGGGTPGAPGTAGWTRGVPGTGGGTGSGPPALFPFDRTMQSRSGSGGPSGGGAGGGQGPGSPSNGQPGSTNGGGQPSAGGATGQAGGTPGNGQPGGAASPGGGQASGRPGNGQPGSTSGGGQPSEGAAAGQTGGTPGSGEPGGAGSPGGGGSGGSDSGGPSGGGPAGGSSGATGGAPANGARSGAVADEAPGAGPPRGGSSGGQLALGGGGGPPAPAGTSQGGLPQDPDDPQGPNLGAGLLPGGERRSATPPARPTRLIGNRDWVIPVECRPDAVVLRNQGQKFAPAALSAGGDNPLLQSLRQTIARRQATVRPGEPPYRPQVRCLIYPEGLKTYYLTLSALEPLGITVTRQKVEIDPSPRPSP